MKIRGSVNTAAVSNRDSAGGSKEKGQAGVGKTQSQQISQQVSGSGSVIMGGVSGSGNKLI